MNGPSEWTESIAAQDFDFESADVDFAGCRGSLNALPSTCHEHDIVRVGRQESRQNTARLAYSVFIFLGNCPVIQTPLQTSPRHT